MLAELLSTSNYCITFPPLSKAAVLRTNLIARIDSLFNTHKFVHVHGESGIGKTTLLAQYAQLQPTLALSAFLQPSSLGMTNPDLVRRELYAQAGFILDCDPDEEGNGFSLAEYNNRMAQLARRAKQKLGKVYFVIDSFGDQASEYVTELLNTVLPIGIATSEFKFLFSGLTPPTTAKIGSWPVQPVELLGLSEPESMLLFSQLNLDPDALKEVVRSARDGHPGRLTLLKHELEAGVDPIDVILEAQSVYATLIEQEWERMQEAGPQAKPILAALAFSRRDLDISDLSIATSISTDELSTILPKLTALVESKQGWRYSSPAHQEHARIACESLRQQVSDNLARLVLRDTSETEALQLATDYLLDAAKHNEVLDIVTPQTLEKAIESSKGYSRARSLTRTGIKAARALSQDADEFGMATLQVLATSLSEASALVPSVHVQLNLGRFEAARNLANACPILVERLKLLALVGRRQVDVSGDTPEDLKTSIKALAENVGPELSATDAIEIGADLFRFLPEVALRLVQTAMGNSDDAATRDKMLSAIAMAAGPAQGKRKSEASYQAFIDAMESEAGRLLLAALKKSSETRDILALLDQLNVWENPESLAIVAAPIAHSGPKQALELLRRLTIRAEKDSSARIPAFGPITVALRATRKHRKHEPLDSILEDLKGLVASELVSPTAEVLALETEMALATPQTPEVLCKALNSIVERALALEDAQSRLESLSEIRVAVEGSLPLGNKGLEDLLLHLVSAIRTEAEMIAGATGLHDERLREVVVQVAKVDLALALNIAALCNTAERIRYLRVLSSAEHMRSEDSNHKDFAMALELIGNAINPYQRAELLSACIESVSHKDSDASSRLLAVLNWCAQEAKTLPYPLTRLETLLQALREMDRLHSTWSPVQVKTYEAIIEDLQKCNSPWAVLEFIARLGSLQGIGSDQRSELDAIASRVIDHSRILSPEANFAYAQAVYLASKALGIAVTLGFDSEEDHNRLATIVSKLPSPVDRVMAWNYLVLHVWKHRNEERAKKLAREYLIPEIEDLREEAHGDYPIALYVAAPALFIFDTDSYADEIDQLDHGLKSHAWWRVTETLVRRTSVDEPFTDERFITRFESEDAHLLLKALDRSKEEVALLRGINALQRSVEKYPAALSKTQENSVIRQARRIVDSSLPSKEGIQHEGFLILSEAGLAKLENGSLKGNGLIGFIDRARSINNTSDRAFVLTSLADIASRAVDRTKLIDEAKKTISHIPAIVERVERLCYLVEVSTTINPSTAKTALLEAWKGLDAVPGDTHRVGRARRRAIDLAYAISPAFAKKLAEELDTDSARVARRSAERHAAILEGRDRLLSSDVPTSSDITAELSPFAVMDAVGAINANRASAPSPSTVLQLTEEMLNGSTSDGFPALLLYLESIASNRNTDIRLVENIRTVVESTLDGAAFFFAALDSVRGTTNKLSTIEGTENAKGGGKMIGHLDKDKATEYISAWLRDNAAESIVFLDGYLSSSDFEFFQLCQQVCPRVPLIVITSLNTYEKFPNTADEFSVLWRRQFNGALPNCTIYFVGIPDGRSPIHDRYLLGDRTGLHIGTSYGGLGARGSTIAPLSPEVHGNLIQTYVQPLLDGATRVDNHSVTVVTYSVE